MFTGIVRAIGVVESITDGDDGVALRVDASALLAEMNDDAPRVGDSIAVNGACLTLAALRGCTFAFDISPETLAKCLIGEWTVGTRLNLEPALTLRTPLGGHLIAGHIDGVGKVTEIESADSFTRMRINAPRALGALLAIKGSVAVDGVSLTVNDIADDAAHTQFGVMLVPHTLRATTLGELRAGARVHIEIDPVARYVQRLLDSHSHSQS